MKHTGFDHRKYRPAEAVPSFHRTWPDRAITHAPIWVSEDLRDGNQALVEPMDPKKKRKLWRMLVAIGFKEIMVGFPAASQPDFDFVRWLIEAGQIPEGVTIAVLVQAREHLIARTFEALAGAPRAIVHVYNSTSKIQRERVFAMERDGIVALAQNGARWIKERAEQAPETQWQFEYTPESFSGTELDFSLEICQAVMEIWQPTPDNPCILNLPTTVEVGPPNHFADQVEYFCQHLPNRDCAIVSVHTHNDRGGAVASAELALMAGAERVEGTLLGNGERSGNVDLITLAMNLYSQGIDPELDLAHPDHILQVLAECTGMPVHPRHPWIGELVYTAFSGSHQDAIRKSLKRQKLDEPWQVAYLPIDPADIGRDYQAVIRVNSQSGKGGMAFLLERDFGISLPRWLQMELAPIVQERCEQEGGELTSAVVHELLVAHFACNDGPFGLHGYQLEHSAGAKRLRLEIGEAGQTVTLEGSGTGAIAAFVDAWQHWTGCALQVVDYAEHALGEGTDATAAAYVLLSLDGQRVGGMAMDVDTVSASLRAVLAALNRAEQGRAVIINPALKYLGLHV